METSGKSFLAIAWLNRPACSSRARSSGRSPIRPVSSGWMSRAVESKYDAGSLETPSVAARCSRVVSLIWYSSTPLAIWSRGVSSPIGWGLWRRR